MTQRPFKERKRYSSIWCKVFYKREILVERVDRMVDKGYRDVGI